MCKDFSDHLFDEYRRLIDRAASGEVLPPGGCTPRELGVRLKQLMQDRHRGVDRLTLVIERAIYAQEPEHDAIQEARGLIAEFIGTLPEGSVNQRVGSGSRWDRWMPRLKPIAFVVAALGLMLLIVFTLANMRWLIFSGFSLTGGSNASSASRSTWSADYGAEASSVFGAAGQWKSEASHPTWIAMYLDPVHDPVSSQSFSGPGFDLDTGTDGYFPNRKEIFDPPLGATHRLFVYDAITSRYQYRSNHGALRDAMGNADASAKAFDAEIDIRLRADTPTPIPSPTPDAIVTAFSSRPRVQLAFVKDCNDTLMVICSESRTVRLRYQLATWSNYSFMKLPEALFVARTTQLPANVAADAEIVRDYIGGLPAQTFADTVRRLQSYFAGFSVNPIRVGERQHNRFLTIALNRRGVCRHRARTFFVLANSIGIPTRLVENRVHSFCEIQLPDGRWRRMEFRLGNEEGPPGPTNPHGTRITYGSRLRRPDALFNGLWISGAFVFLGLLITAHYVASYRSDTRSHRLIARGAVPITERRAHRDMRRRAMSQASRDMIKHLRRCIEIHLGLPENASNDALRIALQSRECPRDINRRIRRLMSIDSADLSRNAISYQMTQYYWDCNTVLRYFERNSP